MAMLPRYDWAVLLMLPSFRACLEEDKLQCMDEAFGMVPPAPLPPPNTPDSAPAATETSKHLERYTSWKLNPSKIQSLTHAESKGTQALARVAAEHTDADGRPLELEFYASGKRGMLFVDRARTRLVKVQKHDDHGVEVIEKESRWLAIVNRASLGPRLLGTGDGYLMCEFLADGLDAIAYLQHPHVTRAHVAWFLRSVMYQCFVLDTLGINKAEMTHPMRHIIVLGTRVVFVDFEKCTYGRQRRNVTQVCQFLSSPRIVAAMAKKGHGISVDKLRAASKAYKARPHASTLEPVFRALRLT
ncbi:hypothetical protein ACHHYP_02868 [Achlya hypogyna]|uniref:Protein kinase domain-containing protein n=1 Tax=Achlya hypogyna TaxID=1202772 RepID=A0A1V9ZRP9_ACHHY|nr:hypothetical protein ACHHYP_02868 [Achlya hypogyna]